MKNSITSIVETNDAKSRQRMLRELWKNAKFGRPIMVGKNRPHSISASPAPFAISALSIARNEIRTSWRKCSVKGLLPARSEEKQGHVSQKSHYHFCKHSENHGVLWDGWHPFVICEAKD
jgi:hypothetical protein